MIVSGGVLVSRIIGSGIRIKLGIWRVNLGDRHLASSLVAGGLGGLGELTLSATLTLTQTRAFGEFGLKLYTDTDTQHKCSSCSCKFKRNVIIFIKVVCYTYLAATTNLFQRNWKKISTSNNPARSYYPWSFGSCDLQHNFCQFCQNFGVGRAFL